MMDFIESSAGRIADRIQNIGASFDPEVLSLPGGSVIALALWAYGGISHSMRSAARRAAVGAAPPAELPARAAARACIGCSTRD